MSDIPLAPGGPGPAPAGLGMPMQPPMVPNPAFAAWAQQAQAWFAEKQKREQTFAQACELIKGDAQKRFKIDIEADSTVAADEQAEKQARVEFLTAITPFLETVLPQMAQQPAMAPLGKELVLFAVRGFRVSRQLEDAFETALDALIRGGAQPPPGQKPPGGNTKSPMEIQAQAAADSAKAQVQHEANMVKMLQTQSDAQLEREKMAMEAQSHTAELALHNREIEGRELLEAARMQHLAARNADGLV